MAQFILSYFSSVTKSLQAVNCDLAAAYRDIHLSKETVAKARCETTWDKLYERIESIASEIDVTIVRPRNTTDRMLGQTFHKVPKITSG